MRSTEKRAEILKYEYYDPDPPEPLNRNEFHFMTIIVKTLFYNMGDYWLDPKGQKGYILKPYDKESRNFFTSEEHKCIADLFSCQFAECYLYGMEKMIKTIETMSKFEKPLHLWLAYCDLNSCFLTNFTWIGYNWLHDVEQIHMRKFFKKEDVELYDKYWYYNKDRGGHARCVRYNRPQD